ncbi:MAG: TonB-dependent receptor [Dongiaceae bacterium]
MAVRNLWDGKNLWLSVAVAGTAFVAGIPGQVQAEQGAVYAPRVTVTATTNPIEAFEYPGSVTVLDSGDIQNRIPSTIDDVLKGVPNTTMGGGPRRNGETPIIRGFGAQDVIVLLDGTRQNLLTGHEGRFFLDPLMLDQVEVVRGAGSALYGSGGLGGVIEFRTRDAEDLLAPGETFGVSPFVGGQSVNDEYSTGLTVFGQPGEQFDFIGSFLYRNAGDISLGDGSTLDSDDDLWSGLGKATFTEGPHSIQGAWLRYDGESFEPINPQDPSAPDRVERDVLSQNWRLTYEFQDPSIDWLDLNATAYYQQYEIDDLRLDAMGAGPTGETLTRHVDTIGFRLDNSSYVDIGEMDNVIFTYGAEAYQDKQDGDTDGADRDGVPNADATFAGVFAQAEFDFIEPLGLPGELLVIPGVRYDSYTSDSDLDDSNSDDAISPKIGASYLPTEWLMFYGSYAHAFSAPTMNDLYLTGTHFDLSSAFGFPDGTVLNLFEPNPDLKPQTTRTYELGAGVQFEDMATDNDLLTAKGTWFLTYGKDLIDLDVIQPIPFFNCNPMIPGNCNGSTTATNVHRAKLQGVEFETGYENDLMILEAAYAHIDGEDRDTGEPLGSLQPDTFTGHAAAKIEPVDMQIGWRITVADDFTNTDDPSEERDGYTVNDVYALWQPLDFLAGFSLAVGVDNIFDKSYSRVFTGADEPGRNYKTYMSYTIAW